MILKYLFRNYWGSFEILGELFFSPQGTDLMNICRTNVNQHFNKYPTHLGELSLNTFYLKFFSKILK